MLSSSRISSALGSKAALILVVLCASCSAESPSSDRSAQGAGGTGGSAGSSGGAGGEVAVTGGAGGAAATTTGGPSADVAQAGNAAAGSGGMPAAGSRGEPGGAGTGGTSGTSGAGGSGGTAGAAGMGGSTSMTAGCDVSPITAEMRSQYQNMDDAYYQKYASANGVIVATGTGVDDEAVVRYCRLLTEMISNEQVRQAILADDMWFTMIADDEQLSSLPQINSTYGTSLNARARGLGGLTPTICAEDSIMCMPGDPWDGDCICPHETGHTLYSSGIARVPELSSRLTKITNDARSSGRLANAYVWMDGDESGMMAWGVQVWYDCAINGTNGAYHSDINTRAELQTQMPDFYQFLSELLPVDNEYQDCYANP